MRNRIQAIAATLVAAACLACNTVHSVHVPRTAETMASGEAAIDHCLASLGFEDDTREEVNPSSSHDDPTFVTSKITPPGSVWSSSSQTVASVRRHPERWSVAFISRGSSHSAEVHSTAFASCIRTHSPGVEVQVESEQFIDPR